MNGLGQLRNKSGAGGGHALQQGPDDVHGAGGEQPAEAHLVTQRVIAMRYKAVQCGYNTAQA